MLSLVKGASTIPPRSTEVGIISDAAGNLLQINPDGTTQSIGGGGGTAGTNISIAAGVVSTVLTGFAQEFHGTGAGISTTHKASRGTSGSPTAIVSGDYVSSVAYKGYDGSAYTQGMQVGVRALGTIAGGSIPSEFYVYQGTAADPFGTSTNTIAWRVFADGAVGIGFKAGIANLDFLANDTAALNTYNSPGNVRNFFAGWMDNSNGTPVAVYIDHGALSTNTAGAEVGSWVRETIIDGSFVVSFSIQGVTGGTAQSLNHQGTVAHPGQSWIIDPTTGFYLTSGAGDDFDIHLGIAGVRAYDFYETGTGANRAHIIRANSAGTSDGGFQVFPVAFGSNHTGVWYDHVSGSAYAEAPQSSFAIGPPGALATNATAGFLALPTCAGTPTGVPANPVSGKIHLVYDTTANKLWAGNNAGTWKSVALT
jgi:hypothetical protein